MTKKEVTDMRDAVQTMSMLDWTDRMLSEAYRSFPGRYDFAGVCMEDLDKAQNLVRHVKDILAAGTNVVLDKLNDGEERK